MKRCIASAGDWLLPSLSALFVATSGIAALHGADPRGTASNLFAGTYQRAYEGRFEDALPFRNAAQHAWTTARMALLGEVSSGALMSDSGWLFTLEEFVTPPDAPDFTAELEATQASLAAQGIRLIPLIVPDKARVLQAEHSFARSAALVARYDDALDAISKLGLPRIDARTALAPLGNDAFFRTDTHWTPYGAQAVAAALAPQIAALGLDPTAFETEQTQIIPHIGDLMRYLPLLDPDAAGFAPEPLPRYTTVAAGGDLLGGGLFGDAPVLASLIGTSFSANPNWHFDGWLKQETGIDLINRADEGQGPFAPMRAYLADQTAQSDTSAGLVIWEIPERYTTLGELVQRGYKTMRPA